MDLLGYDQTPSIVDAEDYMIDTFGVGVDRGDDEDELL